MSQLLVSVRSAAEACIALEAGAALIDVKEPSAGSLGRASDHVIEQVVRLVNGRRPVSAALGELLRSEKIPTSEVNYCKWGLAGCVAEKTWPIRLGEAIRSLTCSLPQCQGVAVAYADWQKAEAPAPPLVPEIAACAHCEVVLLDTWCKTESLLECLTVSEIKSFCEKCHQAGVQVALAGSLGKRDILRLQHALPDWFAVRGAVCEGQMRERTIDPERVRELVGLFAASGSAANAEN